ncbi:hypothetical protein Aduo_003909 [Ancylostoma duodenale]
MARQHHANHCSRSLLRGHRFAFDPLKGRCVQFTFGGCFGNDNNFETLAECVQTCRPSGGLTVIPSPIYDIDRAMYRPDSIYGKYCKLPIESGPCLAYMKR